MSNKAQLQINNTELSTLIETLRGKAAGGDTSVELQEKTVTPTTAIQEVQPDTGYDGLSKVTVEAMPTATQATPSITVSSAGLITASATQSAGYVAAGTKSATKQLTVQAAQTITPGTSNKTIASGRYLTGTQTIKGDANLKATNIAAGVSIFGVTGTHSGGGTDTSDATATAADIVEGETAYVNGTKLTGTNPYEKTATDAEVSSQATKLAELKTILQGKATGGGGAAIDTCTFTVNGGGYICCATIFDSGEFSIVKANPGEITSVDNAVCGTVVYIRSVDSSTDSSIEYILSNCSFAHEASGSTTLYTGIVIDQGVTNAIVTISGGMAEPPGKG